MTAEECLRAGDLEQALASLIGLVKKQPANLKNRVFLFQLFTVLGQWDRALTQLNVAGDLDAAALPMVQTYREALQCDVKVASVRRSDVPIDFWRSSGVAGIAYSGHRA